MDWISNDIANLSPNLIREIGMININYLIKPKANSQNIGEEQNCANIY